MKRLFAVVGLAAFIAACSDSNTTAPVSQLRPGVAAHAVGDPPPPPLSGTGDGSLELGGDLVPLAAASGGSIPQCGGGHGFDLSYAWDYLQPDPNNQQVVHLKLDGSPTNGEIVMHQNQNGKSNAQGTISDGSFSLNLQSGDVIELDPNFFEFTVTGILTNLATGFKCVATGTLEGNLQGSG